MPYFESRGRPGKQEAGRIYRSDVEEEYDFAAPLLARVFLR